LFASGDLSVNGDNDWGSQQKRPAVPSVKKMHSPKTMPRMVKRATLGEEDETSELSASLMHDANAVANEGSYKRCGGRRDFKFVNVTIISGRFRTYKFKRRSNC